MSISHILQSGLAEARGSGAKQVELHHLPEGGADELANETLTFLRGRPARPSSVSGWTAVSASNAGVIAWWADEAGLTTESQRRKLRTLRRQTYDLLDERGLIVKPVSPSAAVDVSPLPATTTETAGAEPVEPEAAAADVPQAVPAEAEAAPGKQGKPVKAAKVAKPTKAPKPAKEPKAPKRAKAAKPAKESKPAKAPQAEPAPAESAPTGAAVASDGVGAWVLRLDPTVWDLARFVADGNRVVSAWAVEDNERSAAMTSGQRVFLWAGGDGTLIMPGVWGAGWVVGPCQSKSVADGYWVDPAGNSQQRLFADVSIEFLAYPVGVQQVADDPRLASIEVLRDPFGSNPSRLTPEEAVAMLALVGLDPVLPA